MSPLRTVIVHELRALSRDRLVAGVFAVCLVMTALAGYIGYSSISVVNKAYDLALPHMSAVGHVVANPATGVSALSLQRNLPIYFFLVGSLLAIVLGYVVSIRDRVAGTTGLVLSRSVTRQQYAAAKSITAIAAMAACIAGSFIVAAVASLLLPGLHLSLAQTGRLAVFFVITWVYTSVFAVIAVAAGLRLRNSMQVLLVPVVVWIVVGFVLPQLATTLEPTALLNPVSLTASPPADPALRIAGALVSPLSLAAHYKETSGDILEFSSQSHLSTILAASWSTLVGLSVALTVVIGLAQFAARRIQASEGETT